MTNFLWLTCIAMSIVVNMHNGVLTLIISLDISIFFSSVVVVVRTFNQSFLSHYITDTLAVRFHCIITIISHCLITILFFCCRFLHATINKLQPNSFISLPKQKNAPQIINEMNGKKTNFIMACKNDECLKVSHIILFSFRRHFLHYLIFLYFFLVDPQRFFVVATAIHIAICVKPPNYIEKPKVPDKVRFIFVIYLFLSSVFL